MLICGLNVQIANSWGQKIDKLNFEGRRNFVQHNLEKVLDSAERPLDGHRSASKVTSPEGSPHTPHTESHPSFR